MDRHRLDHHLVRPQRHELVSREVLLEVVTASHVAHENEPALAHLARPVSIRPVRTMRLRSGHTRPPTPSGPTTTTASTTTTTTPMQVTAHHLHSCLVPTSLCHGLPRLVALITAVDAQVRHPAQGRAGERA